MLPHVALYHLNLAGVLNYARMFYLPDFNVYLVGLHLRSMYEKRPTGSDVKSDVWSMKNHGTRMEEAFTCAALIKEKLNEVIDNLKEEVSIGAYKKTIPACVIIGDFNMNPSEMAISHRSGFNALPIQLDRPSKRYYNPYAALWGDLAPDQIPGTYRHQGAWHLLDYALFSPEATLRLDMDFLRTEAVRLHDALLVS